MDEAVAMSPKLVKSVMTIFVLSLIFTWNTMIPGMTAQKKSVRTFTTPCAYPNLLNSFRAKHVPAIEGCQSFGSGRHCETRTETVSRFTIIIMIIVGQMVAAMILLFWIRRMNIRIDILVKFTESTWSIWYIVCHITTFGICIAGSSRSKEWRPAPQCTSRIVKAAAATAKAYWVSFAVQQ